MAKRKESDDAMLIAFKQGMGTTRSPAQRARERFAAASAKIASRPGVFPGLGDLPELEMLEASTALTRKK